MLRKFEHLYYLISTQIIVSLISIGSTLLWVRYATPEEYGIYQLLLSFFSVAMAFSMSGLNASAQLSSAKNKEGNFKHILIEKLRYSLIGVLALAIIGGYYQFIEANMLLSKLIYISALLFPIYHLNVIWENWLSGTTEFKLYTKLLVVRPILLLCTLFFGLVILKDFLITVLLLFTLTILFNIFILLYLYTKLTNDHIDPELIHYGLKLSGAMLIPVILASDKFLISQYLSIKEVAIYSIAMILPSQIMQIYAIINRYITPYISSAASVEEAWDYLKSKYIYITILFITLGFLGFIFLEKIIHILFTHQYIESAAYAKWIWLFLSLSIPPVYLANILRVQRIIKFSYYFESFNAIGKVALYILLLPIFGLWGMVYSLIASYIFSNLFFIFYFYKELNKSKKGINV